MARLLAALLAAALPTLATRAGDQTRPEGPDDPFPIEIEVGGRYPVCRSGRLVCPATVPICDDPAIATMDPGKEGLEIVGVSPGKTLCSAMSTNKLRAVFRVTVR